MFICIYKFYSIEPSHFTETNIYVRLDPEAANTTHSYHLKSATIYPQSPLRTYCY